MLVQVGHVVEALRNLGAPRFLLDALALQEANLLALHKAMTGLETCTTNPHTYAARALERADAVDLEGAIGCVLGWAQHKGVDLTAAIPALRELASLQANVDRARARVPAWRSERVQLAAQARAAGLRAGKEQTRKEADEAITAMCGRLGLPVPRPDPEGLAIWKRLKASRAQALAAGEPWAEEAARIAYSTRTREG